MSIESAKQETNDTSAVLGRLVLEFAGPEYIALKYIFQFDWIQKNIYKHSVQTGITFNCLHCSLA